MKTKKLLAALLSSAMVLGTMAVPVLADGNDAQIGETEYATLEAAFAAAQDGETITLLKDTEVSSPITLAEETEYVLDLGTYTIKATTSENRPFTLINGSSLTVNATTGGMNISEGNNTVYGFFNVQGEGAKLTLNGGNYSKARDDDSALIRVRNVNNSLTCFVKVDLNNVNVEALQVIRDDTCSGHEYYLQFDPNITNKYTINGGNYVFNNNGINVDGSITAFNLQYADSYFKNAVMESEIGACVELDGGKAKFEGNTFTVDNKNSIQSWNASTIGISYNAEATILSGTYTSDAYGVAIFSHGGNYEIKGGTISGNEASVKTYYQDGDYNVSISGGEFNGKLDLESHTNCSISGGTFSSDVHKYIAKGYTEKMPESTNENYVVNTASMVQPTIASVVTEINKPCTIKSAFN